jgi:hypothetical protein
MAKGKPIFPAAGKKSGSSGPKFPAKGKGKGGMKGC